MKGRDSLASPFLPSSNQCLLLTQPMQKPPWRLGNAAGQAQQNCEGPSTIRPKAGHMVCPGELGNLGQVTWPLRNGILHSIKWRWYLDWIIDPSMSLALSRCLVNISFPLFSLLLCYQSCWSSLYPTIKKPLEMMGPHFSDLYATSTARVEPFPRGMADPAE